MFINAYVLLIHYLRIYCYYIEFDIKLWCDFDEEKWLGGTLNEKLYD
jgi:hypothetical protein